MEIRVEVIVGIEEPEQRYLRLKMKHGPIDDPAKQPKRYRLTLADAERLIQRLQQGVALLRRLELYEAVRAATMEKEKG